MNSKNKVIDYITIDEVCDIIGIKRNSKAQITRWIKEGKIKGAYKFGKTWAIPINWVKSECNSRNINWEGVELEENQIGVSLDDYADINDYAKKNNATYQKLYNDIVDGREKNFLRFGQSFGIYSK